MVNDMSNPVVRVIGEELGAIGSKWIEVQCTKKMVEWVVHTHGNVWVMGVREFSGRKSCWVSLNEVSYHTHVTVHRKILNPPA